MSTSNTSNGAQLTCYRATGCNNTNSYYNSCSAASCSSSNATQVTCGSANTASGISCYLKSSSQCDCSSKGTGYVDASSCSAASCSTSVTTEITCGSAVTYGNKTCKLKTTRSCTCADVGYSDSCPIGECTSNSNAVTSCDSTTYNGNTCYTGTKHYGSCGSGKYCEITSFERHNPSSDWFNSGCYYDNLVGHCADVGSYRQSSDRNFIVKQSGSQYWWSAKNWCESFGLSLANAYTVQQNYNMIYSVLPRSGESYAWSSNIYEGSPCVTLTPTLNNGSMNSQVLENAMDYNYAVCTWPSGCDISGYNFNFLGRFYCKLNGDGSGVKTSCPNYTSNSNIYAPCNIGSSGFDNCIGIKSCNISRKQQSPYGIGNLCETNADCGANMSCINNVCQIGNCSGCSGGYCKITNRFTLDGTCTAIGNVGSASVGSNNQILYSRNGGFNWWDAHNWCAAVAGYIGSRLMTESEVSSYWSRIYSSMSSSNYWVWTSADTNANGNIAAGSATMRGVRSQTEKTTLGKEYGSSYTNGSNDMCSPICIFDMK